jgi:quinol monooxygenase YgiN
MSETRIVIAAYRAKPGKADVLVSEVRDHHQLLRSEGLATDRSAVVMQAADGTVIEVFEWASRAAIEEAHANPRVQMMWERFEDCAEIVSLGSLAEAGQPFAEFSALDLQLPPPPQPTPDNREE